MLVSCAGCGGFVAVVGFTCSVHWYWLLRCGLVVYGVWCLRWFELLLFDLVVVFDVYGLLIVAGFALDLMCCMLSLGCGL